MFCPYRAPYLRPTRRSVDPSPSPQGELGAFGLFLEYKDGFSLEFLISLYYLKFWSKYLCFHHDDPRVAAVPESLSLLHSYLCM